MAGEGRGDGGHNGRNRVQFPHLFLIGEQPPADQVNVQALGWLEFLLNHGMDEDDFGLLLEVGRELVVGHNADNNINNEDRDNMENNEHHENNINNEDRDNIENNEHHDINNDNNNSNHRDDINNENNNDNIHNHNVDDSADNVDSENANDTSPGDEVGPGVDKNLEDDPLLRRSSKRSREEDEEHIEERSSKRFLWWDEFADSRSDSDTTNNISDDIYLGNNSVAHEVAEEEDPLPGPSWKWSTNHAVVQEEIRVKKSKPCDEFAYSSDDSSDTDTVRTGENLAHISNTFELDENACAAEETNEEVNQQVEEEGPQLKSPRKRSRESDEDSDSGSSKRLRR